MPISALPFAPQLKLHLDKMTAFENGAEWHPCLSVPHLLTTLNHYPLNLKRSGTIIPVGAGPLVATPGLEILRVYALSYWRRTFSKR